MTAVVLDGVATARAIKDELKVRVAALRERDVVPGLGTLLVGEDPGSLAYVGGKHRDSAEVGITVNKNAVPNDPRPPMVTSGVRIGTPALATRGFGDAEFTEVADIIAHTLMPDADIAALSARVTALAKKFPLYDGLTSPGTWK